MDYWLAVSPEWSILSHIPIETRITSLRTGTRRGRRLGRVSLSECDPKIFQYRNPLYA